MTTITQRMIKIGVLETSNAGGSVYQDGSEYFFQISGWTIENEEEADYKSESKRFSSLEELKATIPEGATFRLGDGKESISELHERLKLMRGRAL